MRETMKVLQESSERTKERMLAWREMLRENSHVVDALTATLASTQAELKQLFALQVHQEAVDQAVTDMAQQVEARAESSLQAVREKLSAHLDEVEGAVTALQRSTTENLEEHSTNVGQLLERSLNPVNSYLNSIHVRVDTLRAEVDRLLVNVPRLSSSHDETRDQLLQCKASSDEANGALATRIEELTERHVAHVSEVLERNEATNARLSEARNDLGEELGGLGASLLHAKQQIEYLRTEDIHDLAHEIGVLEQKVAKWIHAHPLPAKISEARLYALEARLAEETDARLLLETTVRGINSSALPPLVEQATGGGRSYSTSTTPKKGSDFRKLSGIRVGVS